MAGDAAGACGVWMERTATGWRRTADRRGFLAMTWLALLTALLCALVPDGPPSSKTIGSAFNPATTAVPHTARSQLTRLLVKSAWDKAKAPDGGKDPHHLPGAAVPASAFAHVLRDEASPPLPFGADAFTLPALAQHRLRFPRAPPLA